LAVIVFIVYQQGEKTVLKVIPIISFIYVFIRL